ncbi:peptidyl-alpha-hydroxyglycine alpha-amidating lyase family protein [Terricaulis silvestris]|uniref:NHL repeat protein n=1 Tax=Terricaulis silvestris TaxID=2686094 RepID=A0A6I6MKI6_9CAUL|nr:peptidyl-alpha-hydroxyglycine alpha-amidating lyase family protein [Terricaulis silvestris]QGZ93656.1 NHL repeat protein [Terricaulis silvestris]
MSLSFAPDPEWGHSSGALPATDVCDVGVDKHDNVYLFARDALPVRVFTREGAFLSGWGEGEFVRPHGLAMGRDGASLFLTDEGSHSVRKYGLDGKLLLEIAAPQGGAPFMSGAPFNRCTHSCETSNGDIHVSDGYGNARIHRFSRGGAFIASWGESGSGPGQFNLPHNITVDDYDRLYIADRENHRIQIFASDGAYLDQWNNLHRPCALTCAADGTFYIGELGPALALNRHYPNLGCAVKVLNNVGALTARFGDEHPGVATTQFLAPHGVAVDSHGDVYIAEVSHAIWPTLFPDKEAPADLPSLRKWKRIAA